VYVSKLPFSHLPIKIILKEDSYEQSEEKVFIWPMFCLLDGCVEQSSLGVNIVIRPFQLNH